MTQLAKSEDKQKKLNFSMTQLRKTTKLKEKIEIFSQI
jgi:hypothetical protein